MSDNTFKKSGWLLLSAPQEKVGTLELMIKDGAGYIKRIGSRLDSLFIGSDLPETSGDKKLPEDLSDKVSLDLNVKAGVSWLKSVFGLVNPSAEVKAEYANSKSAVFNFRGAVVNEVDQVALDMYIQKAKVNRDAKTFVKHLENDEVFIITSIIKCQHFTVEKAKEGVTSVDVNVKVPSVAEVNTGISDSSKKESSMKWEGDEWIVIAVKAVRLLYDKPSWFSSEPGSFTIASAPPAEIRDGDDYPVIYLQSENEIIEAEETDAYA